MAKDGRGLRMRDASAIAVPERKVRRCKVNLQMKWVLPNLVTV